MIKPSRLPRAGVVGWRSPLIYGYWSKPLGIAGAYDWLAVRSGFAEFADRIRRDGLIGAILLCLTKKWPLPRAIAHARGLGTQDSQYALPRRRPALGRQHRCGTLSRKHGRERARLDSTHGTRIVIGAGGPERAIVYGLASRGFRRIAIVNRNYARAVAPTTEFSDVGVSPPSSPAVICSSTRTPSA